MPRLLHLLCPLSQNFSRARSLYNTPLHYLAKYAIILSSFEGEGESDVLIAPLGERGPKMKVYPVNAEKAESTLRAAISGASARGTAPEAKVREALHSLICARHTMRGNSWIAWVDGETLGVIRGAQTHNTARWARVQKMAVAESL